MGFFVGVAALEAYQHWTAIKKAPDAYKVVHGVGEAVEGIGNLF